MNTTTRAWQAIQVTIKKEFMILVLRATSSYLDLGPFCWVPDYPRAVARDGRLLADMRPRLEQPTAGLSIVDLGVRSVCTGGRPIVENTGRGGPVQGVLA
jgi:hypothetical protein